MDFWTTEQRGHVAVATFSNPPHNYLNKPVIDELELLVVQWRDPSIRAVVIQSRPEENGFFTQYSVEELDGLASDPAPVPVRRGARTRLQGDLRPDDGAAHGHHRRDERRRDGRRVRAHPRL